MPITVKAFATVRDVIGMNGVAKIEVREEITVEELLRRLSRELGERFNELVYDPRKNSLAPGVRILVNGRDIDFLKGLSTTLKEGDTVAIIPPIAGG